MVEGIVAERLTKRFNANVAVDRLSLKTREGEVFGFLGPIGAGKTTTISMLACLIHPSEGSALVGGYNIIKEPNNRNIRNYNSRHVSDSVCHIHVDNSNRIDDFLHILEDSSSDYRGTLNLIISFRNLPVFWSYPLFIYFRLNKRRNF